MRISPVLSHGDIPAQPASATKGRRYWRLLAQRRGVTRSSLLRRLYEGRGDRPLHVLHRRRERVLIHDGGGCHRGDAVEHACTHMTHRTGPLVVISITPSDPLASESPNPRILFGQPHRGAAWQLRGTARMPRSRPEIPCGSRFWQPPATCSLAPTVHVLLGHVHAPPAHCYGLSRAREAAGLRRA